MRKIPTSPHVQHLLAILACSATALAAKPFSAYVDQANVVMLFLLVVFLIALRFGKGPALTASFLSVGYFDFLFVPPHLSFAVDDIQYLITFAVMLTVALITGQLVGRLGVQADEAWLRERRTRALYEMASRLAGALTIEQVETMTGDFMKAGAGINTLFFVPDSKGRLKPASGSELVEAELAYAERAYKRGESLRRLGMTGQGTGEQYLPLRAAMRIRGVLAAKGEPDQLERETVLLNTVSHLAAIALERIHYVEVARDTEIQMASERLRNSVLASLSHDLRTPLTAMLGLSDNLVLAGKALPAKHAETAQVLHEQIVELTAMVNNLLDLARLSSGAIILRKEWHSIEEVAGAAIKRLGTALAKHPLHVQIDPALPLLQMDAVLLERVIGNLLDNACKHTPAGTLVTFSAGISAGQALISVCDQGPGMPAGIDLSEPLLRDKVDSGRPAVGLGLTICKAIVEAHAGNLVLEPGGLDACGVCVRFSLPMGTPPVIEEEPAEEVT